MTQDELNLAQSKINELETESADIRRIVQIAIDDARKNNETAKSGQAKLRAVADLLDKLKATVAQHVAAENQEKRRVASELAKKQAEENEAKPKPPSEIELLRLQVARLTEAIQAKG